MNCDVCAHVPVCVCVCVCVCLQIAASVVCASHADEMKNGGG